MVNDDRKLASEYGSRRAGIIRRRLDDLRAADTLEDLRYMPGRFHELKAERKGQWACDLEHPYRLIFTPHEHPIPSNEDGQYVWAEIKGVDILEITNYH